MKTSPTLDPLPKTTFVSLRCRRFFLRVFPPRKLLYFKDVDRETIQKLIEAMDGGNELINRGGTCVGRPVGWWTPFVCEVFKFPDGTQVTRQGSARGGLGKDVKDGWWFLDDGAG